LLIEGLLLFQRNESKKLRIVGLLGHCEFEEKVDLIEEIRDRIL
jgi:hypothetical protein